MRAKKFTSHLQQSEIHVGSVIKSYLDRKKIYKSAVARKMVRKDSGIIRFQKAKSINTAILIEFCYAIKHNFFRDIADLLPPEFSIESVVDTTKDDRIAVLEKEIEILKAEKALLLEVVKK